MDETLRVFAALQSAVKHAVEQTAESPERDAQPSATSVFAGVKQLIPAARTVYVAFDPLLSSRVELTAAIRALNVAADMERHSRIVEIPVIYDGEDMADVADLLGISVDEVVRRHCDTAWSVAFVGFAPGFAYLTGGDPIFDVPRRKVPRLSVPAGAVGLAGTFSGVQGLLSGLNGLGYEGYEIHMGQSASAMPPLAGSGSDIHGVFDAPGVADAILRALCARRGIDASALGSFDAQAYKERQYDLLADAVRQGLDMDYVYRVLHRKA